MVFIVIDAMGSNLFFPQQQQEQEQQSYENYENYEKTKNEQKHNEAMSFTKSKILHGLNAFISHAHPPTVTLPRLKSMMTGMMPKFLDIVHNLISPKSGDEVKILSDEKRHEKISSFLDDDFSILHRLKHDRGWSRMVLLGDETWTRVSPWTRIIENKNLKDEKVENFENDAKNELYYFDGECSETTHSLFVSDTVEVDWNVTRNLPRFFDRFSLESFEKFEHLRQLVQTTTTNTKNNTFMEKCRDWQLLILHYLGLDHLGHVYGISHETRSVFDEKMREMDRVIEQVYGNVDFDGKRENEKNVNEKNDDDEKSDDDNTLIIVCSDHGMTQSGNHGGASLAETESVLLFLSPLFERCVRQHHQKQNSDNHHDDENHNERICSAMKQNVLKRKVNQVDLVPTLSALLGVRIPSRSVGQLILSVLDAVFDQDSVLQLMRNQFLQLWALVNENSHHESRRTAIVDEIRVWNREKLTKEIEMLSQMLIEQRSMADESGMLISIGGMIVSCTVLLMGRATRFEWRNGIVSLIGVTWIFANLVFREYFDRFVAWNLKHSVILCCVLLIYESVLNRSASSANTNIGKMPKIMNHQSTLPTNSSRIAKWMRYCCVAMLAIQLLSLSSSSFIEEEHHMWYYSLSTIFVLLSLVIRLQQQQWQRQRQRQRQQVKSGDAGTSGSLSFIYPLLALLIHRIATQWHQSGIKYQNNGHTIAQYIHAQCVSTSTSSAVIMASCLFTPLMYHVTLVMVKRAKSSTHCSSFGIGALLVVSAISAFSVFLFKTGPVKHVELVYCICLVNIVLQLLQLLHRTRRTQLLMTDDSSESSIALIIPILISLAQLWICIEKVENAPLILLFCIELYCLMESITTIVAIGNHSAPMEQYLSPTTIHMICHMFGMSGFYYFGRNISISSVDFSAAYQGLATYRPILIGGILFLQIYLPRIIPALVIPLTVRSSTIRQQQQQRTAEEKTRRMEETGAYTASPWLPSFITTIFSLFTLQLLMNSVMLFVMRDHLFIWSVFSPKYLWVVGDWLCLAVLTAQSLLFDQLI